MTGGRPEAPESIRAARRKLDGSQFARITGELLWNEADDTWAFPVEITIESRDEALIPRATSWYFVLSGRYPWGRIDLYPAKTGGIKATFPHQDYNAPGDEKLPWRTGDLCLRASGFLLGRSGSDDDPKGEPDRLLWYVDRAVEWLKRASSGTLSREGDEFELPQWKSSLVTVGFVEDEDTFTVWEKTQTQHGLVELVSLGEAGPFAVRRFVDEQGCVVCEPKWGRLIREEKSPLLGAWIRLPRVPVSPPYGAPKTWSELNAALDALGVSAADMLQRAIKPLRDGRTHVLLVGFPIPRRFGALPSVVHWQPLLLPELAHDKKRHNGFTNTAKGQWLADQVSILSPKKGLNWLTGSNWAIKELGSRGQLSAELRAKDLLVIGSGAIGSVVTEILVRGGIHTGVLVDVDSSTAGNLVRHTLSVEDIGKPKVEGVCHRLNRLNPHADFEPVVAAFPELPESDSIRVERCDLVLDCSGTDDVLQALAEVERAKETLFVSVSVGRGARRLYVYSAKGKRFPFDDFREAMAPWLSRDFAEFKDEVFVWEGVGCWHPVFPATSAQIWAFASAAVIEIDAFAAGGGKSGLTAIEYLDGKPHPERVSG